MIERTECDDDDPGQVAAIQRLLTAIVVAAIQDARRGETPYERRYRGRVDPAAREAIWWLYIGGAYHDTAELYALYLGIDIQVLRRRIIEQSPIVGTRLSRMRVPATRFHGTRRFLRHTPEDRLAA